MCSRRADEGLLYENDIITSPDVFLHFSRIVRKEAYPRSDEEVLEEHDIVIGRIH